MSKKFLSLKALAQTLTKMIGFCGKEIDQVIFFFIYITNKLNSFSITRQNISQKRLSFKGLE